MRWMIAIASLACACCVGTADRVVIVRFRPVDQTGLQYTRCSISLSRGPSKAVYEEAHRIGQSVVLEAVIHRATDARGAAPIVRCESASEEYVGKEIGRFQSRVDLGEVIIPRDRTK